MTKNEILISLCASEQTEFGRQDFALQSIPQKVFSSVWEVESEVNNGGFSQYFCNYSAETASFVVEALKTIGAPETAEICRRANECAFPNGLPTTVEATRSLATDFSEATLEQLDTLDAEFYSYPHDLSELLYSYVSRHPQEFGTIPSAID